MTIDELLDIESIRKLRTLYSYYLDAGELDPLVALFTDDAVCEFGPLSPWMNNYWGGALGASAGCSPRSSSSRMKCS